MIHRNKIMNIRLTENEKITLSELAKQNNMSLTRFLIHGIEILEGLPIYEVNPSRKEKRVNL